MKEYIKTFETESAMTEYLEGADIDVFVGYTKDDEKVHWSDAIPERYDNKYFTIEALENGDLTFTNSDNTLYYSLDKTTWNSITSADVIPFHAGDNIMLKGTNMTARPSDGIGTIKFSGNHNVYGNILTLISGDEFPQEILYSESQFRNLFVEDTKLISAENLILLTTTLASGCYYQMFYGCTSLTTAPELPATSLANNCYSSMFGYCTSLTTAPSVLPATTLANYCYNCMFQGCTSLTTAPVLPATTLAEYCYQFMFLGCTNLTSVTCLATDISATDCTNNWVSGVAASGAFVKTASMNSWTTGSNGIPTGWTVVDA